MADNGPTPSFRTISAPQHYAPPTARELRSQAVHRLQVGFLGLCAMLMIVGLANIIMDRARLTKSGDEALQKVVGADAPAQKSASDPLADIGVVPAADPNPTPTPTLTALPPPPATYVDPGSLQMQQQQQQANGRARTGRAVAATPQN